MSVSGTVTVGKLEVTEDSLFIDQLLDVTATNPTHDDVIIYKDSSIDPLFTDGWHSSPLVLDNLTNVGSAAEPSHNEILVWNENSTDMAYPTGWVNKGISTVFSSLPEIVNGIVVASEAVIKGNDGNPGCSDMIMMNDTVSGSGVVNLSIASSHNNNAIHKKELTDSEFVFIQSLDKGEISNLTYTTGTIIRSSKGIYGLSGPFPTPLSPTSLSFKTGRFSTSVLSTSIIVASTGTECEVTLYESDGVTVSDGPTTITANQVTTLSCNSIGEFVVSSTAPVTGVVDGNSTQLRILPPMSSELICWNVGNIVSSLEGTASVSWYRRNGNTGITSVPSGTATSLGAGTNPTFGNNGCVILRADKPISCFTTSDGAGDQSIPGFPLEQLAQSFPSPCLIDDNTDDSIACIAIGSPYEGTATVYDSTGTIVSTFNFTRSTTPAVTADDQLYPAAGKWSPVDSGLTSLDGGYVETNVPAMCAMNFNGSGVWTESSGNEIIIIGTTPENIRADIKVDANGLLRRRDLSATGIVTWEIC